MQIAHMFYPKFRLFNHKLRKISTYIPLIAVISTIAFSYGCTQESPEEIQIQNMEIQPIKSNLKYKLTGNTNLPDSTIVTVSAVRCFVSANNIRSILDRKNVEVKAGKWQAELNLSQVTPDGIREAWQLDKSNSKLTPSEQVAFIATFNPVSQWQKLDEENLEKPEVKVKEPQGKLVRVTNEGQKFVQASKTLTVPVNVVKTTYLYENSKDVDRAWGNRYQLNRKTSIKGSLPPATQIKPDTNSALKPEQQLR